jgi:hypothetical protein
MWVIQQQAKSSGINAVPGEGPIIKGQVKLEDAIHAQDNPGPSDIEHAAFVTAGAACS